MVYNSSQDNANLKIGRSETDADDADGQSRMKVLTVISNDYLTNHYDQQ